MQQAHRPFVPWRDSCGLPLQASAFNQTALVRENRPCSALLESSASGPLGVLRHCGGKLRGIGVQAVAWPSPVSRQSSFAVLFVCCFWYRTKKSMTTLSPKKKESMTVKMQKENNKMHKNLGGAFRPCLIPRNTRTRQQCEDFSSSILLIINLYRAWCLVDFNVHI